MPILTRPGKDQKACEGSQEWGAWDIWLEKRGKAAKLAQSWELQGSPPKKSLLLEVKGIRIILSRPMMETDLFVYLISVYLISRVLSTLRDLDLGTHCKRCQSNVNLTK